MTNPSPPTPQRLRTVVIGDVKVAHAQRITTDAALPIWLGQLCAVVGEGESGKSWIACHAALDVATAGHPVLILDGEMSASAWLKRFQALAAEPGSLARIHYAEMADNSVNIALVKATIAHTGARLIVWDSALSLISRTARSENDNAEVARVYDQIREIVRDGPAGLIVDHTTRGSGSLVSRGATAKFNALDISYGVKLADGSVPGQTSEWSSTVSVEKDRHGLLGQRSDRAVYFVPLGDGNLHIEIAQSQTSTHRLAPGSPRNTLIAKLTALDPPPTSANQAFERLGGNRGQVLQAFKQWKSES